MIFRSNLPPPQSDLHFRARARARARSRIFFVFFLSTLSILPIVPLPAQTTRTLWNDYPRLDFTVTSRPCILIIPNQPAPGNPWIWRTEFFGHEPQADIALLGKGFHVAYMNMKDLYGSPASMKLMDAFYADLTTTRALSQRVVLVGFSRGGLFAFNWGARRPEAVAAIYADAPVCDIKSWPGGKGSGPDSPNDWKKLQLAYDMTESQLMDYSGNPIDNLAPLAKAKIPILIVAGGKDATVPFEENALIVEQRYKSLGGPIETIVKPEGDHHPHSLADPAPIVEFILRATR